MLIRMSTLKPKGKTVSSMSKLVAAPVGPALQFGGGRGGES
jgi:hypothetical protein